jgi:hypothetical protein
MQGYVHSTLRAPFPERRDSTKLPVRGLKLVHCGFIKIQKALVPPFGFFQGLGKSIETLRQARETGDYCPGLLGILA